MEENLDHIDGLTERMGRIISQLKLFARKSSGKPVPVSMKAVIDGALTLLEPRLQRQEVAVIRHLPTTDVFCLGDMVRLEQVLVNLISNALQAMEAVPDAALHLEINTAEGRVITMIRDHGPGYSRGPAGADFRPLLHHQGDRRRSGTGSVDFPAHHRGTWWHAMCSQSSRRWRRSDPGVGRRPGTGDTE